MTPHNRAKKGEIAPIVLAPGDPARATLVATRYLEDAVLKSDVRGMLAYTGLYKGVPISVMGTGMGGPSAGIYSYELYTAYDVETIIRIGTCGGLQSSIAVGDLVIALTASNPQDVFAVTVDAFNMAETYRTPVILLFDEVIGVRGGVVELVLPVAARGRLK